MIQLDFQRALAEKRRLFGEVRHELFLGLLQLEELLHVLRDAADLFMQRLCDLVLRVVRGLEVELIAATKRRGSFPEPLRQLFQSTQLPSSLDQIAGCLPCHD